MTHMDMIDAHPDESLTSVNVKKKKNAAKRTVLTQEDHIFSTLCMYRNKESINQEKINMQLKKIKRKDDKYLADREIEHIESCYQDFGFGEMVMSFPNPDYEGSISKGITLQEAISIYDNNLNEINPSISTQDREFQRKAFILSFLLLEDYIPDTNLAQEEANKKKEEKEKKRKKKINMPVPNKQYMDIENQKIGLQNVKEHELEHQVLISKGQLVEKLVQPFNDKDEPKLFGNNKKRGLTDKDITDMIFEIQYLEDLEIPLVGNLQGEQTVKLPQHQQVTQQNIIQTDHQELKTETHLLEKGQVTLNIPLNTYPSKFQSKDFILELIKGTMNNDMSSLMNVNKKLNKGKFMYKRKYNEDDFDWIITNGFPKDFQTLLRNTIVSKLATNAKLMTRQHLNREASEIVVSIKASEEIIMQAASVQGIRKQIELGYADILSLEPCDTKYRPLRLKYVLRLAVKNCKKNRLDGLDEESLNQKNGVLPIKNLRNYMSMEEDKFWIQLGRKQMFFDSLLLDISEQIDINQDQELVEIIDDNDPLNQKLWSAYTLYLDYMIYYCSKMKVLNKFAQSQEKIDAAKVATMIKNKTNQTAQPQSKKELNPYQKNAGFLYRLIFKQSIEDTNIYFGKVQGFFSQKEKLFNIWHRLEVDIPIPPYHQFIPSSNSESLLYWRTSEINEFKQRSIFSNMEKIKLCDIIVNDHINTLKLLSQAHMLNYFPLHEPHQLKGKQKLFYFQKVIEAEYINEPELTQTQEKVRKMFLLLDNQADSSDFDSQSVIEELRVKIFEPWTLSIDTIRDYYGEKIAIYFQFLSCYSFHLSYMSIIGIIIEIIVSATSTSHPQTSAGFRFFFGIVIIIWQVAFLQIWKQKQSIFAMSYGQEDIEQMEQERPSFKGTFKRSVYNDKLNQQYYPDFRRKLFILTSLFLSFIVIVIVICIIIGLFLLKAYLLENKFLINVPLFNPNALIGILNSIQILIFNAIYMSMNNWMSEKENHQILETYENSYISKVFMFTFCNTFNSCFFISFFNHYMKIEKGDYTYLNFCKVDQDSDEDCFGVLRTQMISIFLINVIKNIPELLVPFLKTVTKKALRKEKDTMIVHPFREIDIFINDQFDLEPYTTNREIDGTVSDYMELLIQFSFLCLFGLAFPLSFLLAFINNVLEIQVDKIKLTYISRRPVPIGVANIGTWFVILEIVSFISIFTNSGLIAFTSDTVKSNPTISNADYYKYQKRIFFVTFIILLAVKYIISLLIDEVPEKVQIIKKRHQNCITYLLNGLNQTKAKSMVGSKSSVIIEKVKYPNAISAITIGKLEDQLNPVEAGLSQKLMGNSKQIQTFLKSTKDQKSKKVQPPSQKIKKE